MWIAGSTHAGEEEVLLTAHASLQTQVAGLLLLLVPRHPERFQSVADLVGRRGFRFERRSSANPVRPDSQVLLVDTVGELAALYAAADVAFVGGSLVPVGGHNLLEPAALGVPVITGPYQSSGKQIARLLLRQGAALASGGRGGTHRRAAGSIRRSGEARGARRRRTSRRRGEPRQRGALAGTHRAAVGRGAAALPEHGVQPLQALLGQGAGCLLQLEHIDHVVVAAARVIGLRLDPKAAGFHHLYRRAGAGLVARFGGIECGCVGLHRAPQCVDPRDIRQHSEIRIARIMLGLARHALDAFLGRPMQVYRLAYL